VATFSSGEFQRISELVRPHLDSFVARAPGAFLERKEAALVLHYRDAWCTMS
jgi:trehalose-6-phosphatase